MKKILLQALVEGDEHSVKLEANEMTGAELLIEFSHICEAVIKAGVKPYMLKLAVDFVGLQLNEEDPE